MKATVDDLKKAVQAAYGQGLDDISPDRLNLYKISANEVAEIRNLLRTLGSGQILQGNLLVQSIFDDVPFFQRPRIVVEPLDKSKQGYGGVDSYLSRLRMSYRSTQRCSCPFCRPPAIAVYPGVG